MKELKDYIRSIPDFPKPGIIFRDINTLLHDAQGFKLAVDTMTEMLSDLDFDVIAGAEARGFVFGAPIAYAMNKPFALVRKKGKLPGDTIAQSYDLEYGSATIEMQTDSIKPGQRVVIVDDLIATGGTVAASVKLVERLGGQVVRIAFLMELPELNGRKALEGYEVVSAVTF